MRLKIVHTTSFSYAAPVTSSYNEARLTPQTTPSQTTLEAVVRTDPPSTPQRYHDYWGTQVTAFDLHRPHDRLDVVASSLVETAGGPAPRDEPRATWVELRSAELRNTFAELLSPTRYTAMDAAMRGSLAEVVDEPDPETAVHAASALAREHLTYRAGATRVATTAAEAWAQGSGVCQDFAHVAIAFLRAAGVPARYVSGYLHPVVEPQVGVTVVGESHAWIEAWVGSWLAVDPTSGAPVGDRHVVVGRARDYGDVSPVRGVYASPGGSSSLRVQVEITRVG
ncbi:transglutaminase family protein [Cellulomonas sp. ATA003]|uniref:transglutaminase family protein n=1 Tax=Cellulomonas sp. ATA003 TaxID=3073064 RepID=UPI002873D91D|nr:transglutaminase family protein [Cellulomonas sp. ATA003]WNB87482.1 transglutaminase family protein [Cellulomonas sp. ATA003]